ncbi:MAG: cAMP/cGMP-dependent 3',5'-cyclic-AMP/GMP phosphodiesterase, partial [Desulfobacterales bacterium]|nr:cAMP/cGMP-dependent 3',5'-cyclic-AMP/GMP phosphodiesterase [Desulfobacterales bacterium]
MQKIKSLTVLSSLVTNLPRGGYLIDTSAGYIQFGSPPETLKDTIFLPKGVPTTFILPIEHFDPKHGMSVAEIEFPIYYNFFLKKKKTIVFVSKDHINNMRIVLQEAIFGPKEMNISEDIEKVNGYFIPDLKAEMNFFRQGNILENMVELFELKPEGFNIADVKITQNSDGSFHVYDKGEFLTLIPARTNFKALFDLGTTLSEPFIPPQFGITCLGPSHGFDPEQNTSGFILWINKVGIMVDPPANSTLWLKDSNVNPKLIDSIILTHCHADHDSGTFQKILEETRINIYTTPTIMKSFLTKYSALTRIQASTLISLFNFHPVKMNGQYNIHGAIFGFYYSLHSIPTMGFYFSYRNKNFIYSSDHLNEPSIINEMYEKGVISKERKNFLINFPWHYDIIYHEAGIPPLHTPINYLNSLPVSVQKKINVYHIAEKNFPQESHLKLAKFGIGETVYPDIKKHKFEDAYHILDIFSRIDVFKDLPFDKIKDLLIVVKKEEFNKGEYIIRKDTPCNKFYVVVSGNVGIVKDRIYPSYEYFGEASLVTGKPSSSDVVALTNVAAYVIEKDSFLRLISNTKVEKNIKKIATIRDAVTWSVIKTNKYF